MCKAVKWPAMRTRFTPERVAVKTGAWTPEEDELLLHGYQKERKTICAAFRGALTAPRTQRATVYICSVVEVSLKA